MGELHRVLTRLGDVDVARTFASPKSFSDFPPDVPKEMRLLSTDLGDGVPPRRDPNALSRRRSVWHVPNVGAGASTHRAKNARRSFPLAVSMARRRSSLRELGPARSKGDRPWLRCLGRGASQHGTALA